MEMVSSWFTAINRRAARFVLSDHRQQSSVSVMMKKLKLLTLEHRRKNRTNLKTNHCVQDCPWSCGSADHISYPISFTHSI